jgi:hypothetical protein
MTGDELVTSRQVGGGDDGVNLFQRHIERAEPADDLGGRDLVGAIPAVSGAGVDIGRFQQADAVVVAQRLDVDAIVAAFAPDAYVNDARREIRGVDAIRRWVEKEMVGDHVTMEPLEVVDHYGDTIVRSRYDGTYDKTNLPGELVMSDYFSVRDGKIVSLAVIRNQPSPY